MAEQQVTPQDARAYVSNYVHDPEALKSMPDDKVIEYHGRVRSVNEKAINDAVTTAQAKAPVFGEKWREHLAGEDKDDMQTLQRMTDPAAVWKSYKELRTKVSKGELKAVTPFPEKGKPEEQAAWRKEHGVPDTPEAYDLNLGDGLVIGEEDKPFVNEYLKVAHSMHAAPDFVKKQLAWYFGDYRDAVEERRAEMLEQKKQETKAALKEAWGPDEKTNHTIIRNLLDAKLPADSKLKSRILHSIETEPEFAQLFAMLGRDINPATTLISGDPAKMEQSIDTEIATIEKVMKADRKAYNADEKMQARYRELLAAKEKMKERQKVTV